MSDHNRIAARREGFTICEAYFEFGKCLEYKGCAFRNTVNLEGCDKGRRYFESKRGKDE